MRIIYCVWYGFFSTLRDVIVVKYFQFMKNNLHWYPSPCIKDDYKIGFWGNFGRMHGLLTSVAVDCIALNYLGKHKRKMAIRGIN